MQRRDRLRDISSGARARRKLAGLRVRLPLARLTVVVADAAALRGDGEAILADELNVKAVELVEPGPDTGERYGVTERLSVNARAAGPRIGRAVQQVIGAAKRGDWRRSDDGVVVGGVPLEPGEFELALEQREGDEGAALGLLAGGGFVVLATATTPELEREGRARDLVRDVQQARRAAGLDVSDRIDLTVRGDAELVAVLAAHGDLVAAETLVTDLDVALDEGRPADGAASWASTAGGRFALARTGTMEAR